MSRAYRIRVRESVSSILRAHDKVSTQLEILEILPADDMAVLLEQELVNQGFERKGGVLVRTDEDGITVTVDPQTGTVTVQAEASQEFESEGERVGSSYDQNGPGAKQAEKALREQLKKDLQKQAEREKEKLQSEVTDRLEAELGGLREELNKIINKVTAEALKQKAAQMGQIKELTEDPQTGSMTIVVEV